MSSRPRVAVLDYGSGNIRSAQRALQRAGADTEVTADFDAALNADGLVVPGVGAFAACMAGIRAVRGEQIIDRRLAGSRPVLGICVGMQVMFDEGVEHGEHTKGCGQWPGTVERLHAPVLPHMGWNTVERRPRVPAAGRPGPRHPLLLRALLRGPGPAHAALGADDAAADQLGHPRRAVHRGRGERPAVRDPVSPREVR